MAKIIVLIPVLLGSSAKAVPECSEMKLELAISMAKVEIDTAARMTMITTKQRRA